MSTKDRIAETIGLLKQQRDELAVQIHLGAMDAKQDFDDAQKKLDRMSEDFEPLKGAVTESAGNVLASLDLVGEEILSSFERVRKSLS